MTTLTPSGDNSTPDTRPYIPSKSPGRMVRSGSMEAQLLHMYGLTAEDVPRGSNGGRVVTLAETLAELERRGHIVDRVWERDHLTEHVVRPRAIALEALGAHVLELKPWTKVPVEKDWLDAPALTVDEMVEAVCARGSGLGINMLRSGPNGWASLDSECAAVTERLMKAGLVPTVVTANGQNPDSEKYGGAHFHAPLPAGIDPRTLRTRVGIEIPCCGKLDVLLGARLAVAPCTRLITSPDTMYDFASGGPVGYTADRAPILDFNLWTPPPAWLTDEAVPPPLPELEPLRGIIAPPKPKPKRAPDPNSDLITQQVDALDWQFDVVAGDPRIAMTGGYASCWCPQFKFLGAANDNSGHFHDCEEFGHGYRLWSGTAMRVLGLPEHGSKWEFAAALRGRLNDMGSVAKELGIDLSGFITANESNPFPVPPPPARKSSMPRIGNVGGVVQLFPDNDKGAGAGATDAPSEESPGRADGADTDMDFALDEDVLDADEEALPPQAKAALKALRAEIEIREKKLATLTPGLGRIYRNARRAGVYMHGLVAALEVRTIANIPPYVLLPDAAGLTFSKDLGSSINHNAILVGPSATGKTRTTKLARAMLRLAFGVVSCSDGTAEGICKKARSVEKGKTVIHATGVLVETDEFDSVVVEMERSGSKFEVFSRKVWTGEPSGSTASDKNRDAQLPAHSTRVCMLFGAQPHALKPLLKQASKGTPQRYDFALVGVVKRADRDPELYGDSNFEPLLVNQEQLPWWTPVGLPPGYRPPDPDADPAEEETEGLAGYDDAAPIWIGIPAVVKELIDAEADRAGARAEDWLHALAEDAAGISGHNIPLQLRKAFAIATLDGHYVIGMEHWEAAALLLEMRQLVQDASTTVGKYMRGVDLTNEGEEQGLRQDAAEASRTARKSLRHRNCERRLFELIDAATGLYPELADVAAKAVARDPLVFKDGGLNIEPRPRAKEGSSPLDSHLSRPQRQALPAVLADLRKRGVVAGDTVLYRASADTDEDPATNTGPTIRSTGPGAVPPATGFVPPAADGPAA